MTSFRTGAERLEDFREEQCFNPDFIMGRTDGHELAAEVGVSALSVALDEMSEILPDTSNNDAYIMGLSQAHNDIEIRKVAL